MGSLCLRDPFQQVGRSNHRLALCAGERLQLCSEIPLIPLRNRIGQQQCAIQYNFKIFARCRVLGPQPNGFAKPVGCFVQTLQCALGLGLLEVLGTIGGGPAEVVGRVKAKHTIASGVAPGIAEGSVRLLEVAAVEGCDPLVVDLAGVFGFRRCDRKRIR